MLRHNRAEQTWWGFGQRLPKAQSDGGFERSSPVTTTASGRSRTKFVNVAPISRPLHPIGNQPAGCEDLSSAAAATLAEKLQAASVLRLVCGKWHLAPQCAAAAPSVARALEAGTPQRQRRRTVMNSCYLTVIRPPRRRGLPARPTIASGQSRLAMGNFQGLPGPAAATSRTHAARAAHRCGSSTA